MDKIISSAIGTAGSLVGTWWQNKQNKRTQLRDQRFQEYMWNQANEYNTPLMQVARLREAGLNPQLALGDVNSVASASLGGQSSTGHSSSVPNIDFLGALESYRQSQLLSEKTKTEQVAQSQMQAQTINTKEQTKFLSSQIKNIDADTRLKLLNYQLENIKRQSGIVGNDMLSNVARSSYGFGQKLGQSVKKAMQNLKINLNNKINEYKQSEFYKNKNK